VGVDGVGLDFVLKLFRRQPKALPAATFETLRASVMASAFVGASTLNGPFESSRGFGVTFTHAGVDELTLRFPALAPWLACTLGAAAIRALTPWWRRTLSRLPNAFYLNLLMIGPGGHVARHVDGTLMQPAGVTQHPPDCVSVLYLSVPTTTGGVLQLWDGSKPVGLITPKTGDAVHFRGDLAHAVSTFEGPPEARRASLVIEQYHFEPEALARLPAFQLDSRAGFRAYLKDHAARPPKPFELER
jgi:hypothetical protein